MRRQPPEKWKVSVPWGSFAGKLVKSRFVCKILQVQCYVAEGCLASLVNYTACCEGAVKGAKHLEEVPLTAPDQHAIRQHAAASPVQERPFSILPFLKRSLRVQADRSSVSVPGASHDAPAAGLP